MEHHRAIIIVTSAKSKHIASEPGYRLQCLSCRRDARVPEQIGESMTIPDRFHDRMITILPKLKLQAMAFCRNRSLADDLVQEVAVKALTASRLGCVAS